MKDYVDTTPLRFEGDGFIRYAQLNQVGFEALETRSMVAEYQRNPVRLVKEFASEEAEDARTLAFDLHLTAEPALGAGAFAKLDEKQRATVINAFDCAVAKMADDWALSETNHPNILASESKNIRATLLALFGQGLARFSLAARNGVWYVTEIEDADVGELSFSDPLQAIFNPATSVASIRPATNLDRALQRLEQVIASKGESVPLLLLKSNLLRAQQFNARVEERKPAVDATNPPAEKAEKAVETKAVAPPPTRPDEARLLLEKITARWPDYAPAQYALANSFDEEAQEKAIVSYQRYAKLMPLDPRPWEQLAFLYNELKRLDEAEAAYREIIARDRENMGRQADLIVFTCAIHN